MENLTRGQIIQVIAYPNKVVERVVLEEKETYVLCCRKEIFEDIQREGDLSESYMGFPKESILGLV